MKKLILIALISLIFFPHIALAKDLSVLRVSFSDDINASCKITPGYNPIKACYCAGEKMIFIRSDIPLSYLSFVFFHEVGHFLMESMASSEYESLFQIAPELTQNSNPFEYAADTFSLWVLGARVTPEQKKFFVKILTQ